MCRTCVFEVIPTLLLGVEVADVTDGSPERVDCPCADAPEMSLELGDGHFATMMAADTMRPA